MHLVAFLLAERTTSSTSSTSQSTWLIGGAGGVAERGGSGSGLSPRLSRAACVSERRENRTFHLEEKREKKEKAAVDMVTTC